MKLPATVHTSELFTVASLNEEQPCLKTNDVKQNKTNVNL